MTLLAVAMPEHAVFEPLIAAVARREDLAERRKLLADVFHEAHAPSSAPIIAALRDQGVADDSKAELLRAVGDSGDAELKAAIAPFARHKSRELARFARRLIGEQEAGENKPYMEPVSGIRFLYVPGGRFQMGAEDIDSDSRPSHYVRVSGFWLGETAVTNAQYARFVETTGHKQPAVARDRRFAHPQQPVVGVSWQDAAAYCAWLSKRANRCAGASGLPQRPGESRCHHGRPRETRCLGRT